MGVEPHLLLPDSDAGEIRVGGWGLGGMGLAKQNLHLIRRAMKSQ